jgi:proton-dependent oligopeptide transporter, POT family
MELKIGFWSAYLLSLIMFVIGTFVLIAGKRKYVIRPPKGSVIVHCFKVIWIALRSENGLNAAKPSFRHTRQFPWDDTFIEELRRALVACKVFLFFPLYWLVYNQVRRPNHLAYFHANYAYRC